MTYKKYPDEAAVNEYIAKREPLIIAVPFDDNEPVLMSMLDDSFEHHILLQHFGINPNYMDRYCRHFGSTVGYRIFLRYKNP